MTNTTTTRYQAYIKNTMPDEDFTGKWIKYNHTFNSYERCVKDVAECAYEMAQEVYDMSDYTLESFTEELFEYGDFDDIVKIIELD